MKLKVVADSKNVKLFIIYAIFLLYIVCIAVLNIPEIASTGSLYGDNIIQSLLPFDALIGSRLPVTLMLYIFALGASFFSVQSYFFEFEKGVGIGITNGATGGYSDWARDKDIKNDNSIVKIYASDSKTNAAGVPLICNGKELWVDNGEYHTLVIGATGAGKTQDVIFPTIKVLAKHGESIICTDPKGELYNETAGLLKAKGYDILVLNFRDPQNGGAWNPLSLPYKLYKNGNEDKAIELLDDLAANILYDENSQNQDPFWEKTSADYFTGIALAMFEDTTEDKININSINMIATVGEDKIGGSTYIKEYFSYKNPDSPAYVNASGTILAPTDTKGSIISVFKQKVKLFAERKNLSEMLSHTDIDLYSIGKRPTAVYIIIQDEKKTLHPLATIFLKQVYETLIDTAQENGGKLPVRTNFLLDEFANMPPLKDVTTMITAARSRQIRFTLIIQNYAQLNKVYGKDDAETIKGNCGNIIYLISTELQALEEISKLCGEKKSKQSSKTASTPLVTVNDLQRMKQFDHIVLRLRKSPFKTSFIPNFRIDWGRDKYQKLDLPQREMQPGNVFDIREFVNEKRAAKMAEARKAFEDDSSSGFGGGMSSGFGSGMSGGLGSGMSGGLGGGMSGGLFGGSYRDEKPQGLFNSFDSKQSEYDDSSIDIDDLIKKIDDKLEAMEKEEEEEKNKQDSSKDDDKKEKVSETKDTSSKKSSSYDDLYDLGISFDRDKKEDKKKSSKDEDTRISSIDIENKVNKKLSNELIDDEDFDLLTPIEKKTESKKEEFKEEYSEKTTKESKHEEEKSDGDLDEEIEAFLNRYSKNNEKEIEKEPIEPIKETEVEDIPEAEYTESKKENKEIKLEDKEEDEKFFDDFFDD